MPLDFALTQLYRLVVDDFVLIYDAYNFYKLYKPENRSVKELCELLANLVEVEAQNFEDTVVESKLTKGEEETVSNIVWDYVTSIIIKYVLDDFSQYPFWAGKIAVATHNETFGSPVIKRYFEYLKTALQPTQFRRLLQGSVPYTIASFITNFPYLVKCTNNFILTMLSKLPRPPSKETIASQSTLSTTTPTAVTSIDTNTVATTAVPTPPNIQTDFVPTVSYRMPKIPKMPMGSPSKSKKNSNNSKSSYFNLQRLGYSMILSALSHPFLVLSVSMITNPLYQGKSWLYVYYKYVSEHGVRGLYNGLRSRLLFNLIPIASYCFLGISDSLIYRRMLGQGSFDSTGGFLSVARELTDITTGSNTPPDNSNNSNSSGIGGGGRGSALSLLNYGLLTAVHILPGFACFITMRSIAWMAFGSSIHRKHQYARRNEIVQAYVLKVRKRHSISQKQQSCSQENVILTGGGEPNK